MTTQNQQNNYFDLLGLSCGYDIDLQQLSENYRRIQRSVHPDNFANASEQQRRISVQKAAQINDALQTLKSPLKRAIYLLSLYGIELSEKDNQLDPGFLMEQMELREALSLVSEQSDPYSALDALSGDVKNRLASLGQDLSGLFTQINDPQIADKENLLIKAKAEVLKMQFLNRLEEECLRKEEDLAEQF